MNGSDEISVAAVFKNGIIFPRWFIRKGKKITIDEVTYRWSIRKGNFTIRKFAVISNGRLYQISFFSDKSRWLLEKED